LAFYVEQLTKNVAPLAGIPGQWRSGSRPCFNNIQVDELRKWRIAVE
jgi:hypothetical protein